MSTLPDPSPRETTPPGTSRRVLVTGGSGFIAGHVVLALLAQGHQVRTTVRSRRREPQVRAALEAAGMTRGDALEFVEADLTADAGWAGAVADREVVLHVASPVRPGRVADEAELVVPAREGTLRVLRAARDGGVRRVVLTSAFHAAGFGHENPDREFTEADWSPLDGPGMDAYGRSKTLAELAAWDFVAQEAPDLELVTLLPVAVMGPLLGDAVSGSNHLVQNLLSGKVPGLPNTAVPLVDVRDVAAAHAAAAVADGVAGERFLIASGEPAVPMREMGRLLRERFGAAASKVPTRSIPDLVVRAGALANPELRTAAAELGAVKRVRIDKARRLLGYSPRPGREALVAAAESLIARSLV